MATTNTELKMPQRLGFEDICAQFNVPAKKGARVVYQGQPGTVTTARGLMVRVRLDGMTWSRPYMPDELEWIDEADEGDDGDDGDEASKAKDDDARNDDRCTSYRQDA